MAAFQLLEILKGAKSDLQEFAHFRKHLTHVMNKFQDPKRGGWNILKPVAEKCLARNKFHATNLLQPLAKEVEPVDLETVDLENVNVSSNLMFYATQFMLCI